MTPGEFREWVQLYEELQSPDEEEPGAWQELLWKHLETQNHVSTYQDTDYSEAICWAAFFVSLAIVLSTWIAVGALPK